MRSTIPILILTIMTACTAVDGDTTAPAPSSTIVIELQSDKVYLRSHGTLSVHGDSFRASSLPLDAAEDNQFEYETWVTASEPTTIVGSDELDLSVDEGTEYEVTIGNIVVEYQNPHYGYDTTFLVESPAAALDY